MKIWMTCGHWRIMGRIIPIRSVVKAKTRREAQKGADKAVRRAACALVGWNGKPQGSAMVLYAM